MELLRTPLYSDHLALGGKMIPFDGFDMPVQYTGIIDEHVTVRERVGIFDVCHMGEIELHGKDALRFTDYIVTNSVSGMRDGDIKYSPLCYPDGGQVDDIFVYRVSEEHVLLVVNASPEYSVKDFDWIREHSKGFDVTVLNRSKEFAEVALQGPLAPTLLGPLLRAPIPVAQLSRFKFVEGTLFDKHALVSRTGYTGEDGFEIFCDSKDGVALWRGLLDAGKEHDIRPCGLGARDTLRFEVCYWLYGNDIDENTNPLETGQGWTVKFDKQDFIGKEALLKVKQEGPNRKLTGLHVPTGGIARTGMEVKKGDLAVGLVRSGNYCPSLKQVYAMAMVDLPHTAVGSELAVTIRGRDVRAQVVGMPFVTPFNKR